MLTAGLSASEINRIAIVNTVGHAVLVETLKMAVYYLSHSNGLSHTGDYGRNFKTEMNEARSCYLFVQGTGLEITINDFDLNYNPDRIRSMFNYLVRHSV